MTWKEMLADLKLLSEEQLNQDATVCLMDMEEAIKIERFGEITDEHKLDGVLDDGHIILEIDF